MLPGVDVTVVNAETNLVAEPYDRFVDGRFVFLQLPPGRYNGDVPAVGFLARIVQDNIDLTVGQAINLILRLAVGNVTETVTVSGTPVVETTRAGGCDRR